eukprot:1194988-Prorocentrum_minimum.AAC.2
MTAAATLLGSAWLCVALRGFAWLCVALRGSAWLCLALRGSAWLCLANTLGRAGGCRAYGQSKLAQIMFCYELQQQVWASLEPLVVYRTTVPP